MSDGGCQGFPIWLLRCLSAFARVIWVVLRGCILTQVKTAHPQVSMIFRSQDIAELFGSTQVYGIVFTHHEKKNNLKSCRIQKQAKKMICANQKERIEVVIAHAS